MRQQIARAAKNTWLQREVYPIIGVMSFAGSLVACQVVHAISGKEIGLAKTSNPDAFLHVPKDHNPNYVKVLKEDIYQFE
ncbi:hypothetical protein AYI69_g10009 [Smittium culicis]|uniref:Uncharacterized protein n=1 Tax=Smittium culicis TaxID=133412 RepID=A0A1R1X8S0_9FUNG|nr:hypothetical protein AYI69_g10009 [Smittium culicis]